MATTTVDRSRYRMQCVDSVRAEAGSVEAADVPCRNGTPGCPGANNPTGELPCFDCLANAGDGGDE